MLFGRQREQDALEGLLAAAKDGRSGVLALVGEAGIGKSALLDFAAERATGMQVLRARAVASEAQIPFAGLFELLRPALGRLDRIPAPQASALESALALRPARAEDRFAVGAATLSLLAAYAETEPLAVLVDDVHWLDGSSADALVFAVRRLLAEPIAVLLSARVDEPSVLDTAGLPVLRLDGLDAEAAELLLRREAPDTGADVAARLHRDTGGNPLALLELAGEQPAEIPLDTPLPVVTSVARAYLQRAATLPVRTRDALVLAAATDRGDLAVLARAAVAMGIEVGDLSPAEQAGLVTVRDRIEFRHPLARSAIYGDATAERRREVHRALAGALPDADADRRAWHLALAAAGPDATASSALEQAARRAHERSAYDVASQAFERAALLAAADERRGALLYAAADAAWLGGNAERAVTLLDETRGVAVETVEIDYLRGLIALRRGPLREGRQVLLAAAERAEPEAAAVMLAEAAMGAFYAADAAGMLACAERASALAARAGSSRAAFLGGMAHGMALVIAGEGEPGAASIRNAMQILESSDELDGDLHVLLWATMCPLWLREADIGAELVDRMVQTARSRSAVGVLPHLLANLAIQHATTDSWVQAQVESDEAIRLARETGQRVVLAGALARLSWLEARLGREEACRAHAAEALAIAREQGVVLCEIWALTALGELELGLGNADAALRRLEEQQRVIEQQGIGDADLFPAPELVELYLRLGRADEAGVAAAAFERVAAAKGQPWALARSARCGALLAADADFEARFEEALTLHALTPDLFETARTELAFGARLRRGGRRVRAREHLRIAIETFDDLGAAPWAELTRAQPHATGETAGAA